MNKLVYSLVIFTILGYIIAGTIKPDSVNPFIITNPHNKVGGSDFTFNFQLDTGSKGLTYGQYIAVVFPKWNGTTNLGTSNWDFANTSSFKFSCALYKNAATAITVEATKPTTTGEENVAYCKITDDGLGGAIPLVAGQDYRLVITIPEASKPATAATALRNFDLYTTTSITSTGFIMDTGMGFADGYIFNDYTATGNNMLKISETIAPCSATGTDLASGSVTLQYSTFNARIKFKNTQILRWGPTAQLNFEFPTSVGTLPTSYISTDATATTPTILQKKLDGSFATPVTTSTTTQIVSGFTDSWLPANREFNIILVGMIASDLTVSSPKIKAYVNYKNSLTRVSYFEATFITTTAATTTLTVAHNEGWDIYMGGAWPLLFTVKVTTTQDLKPANGLYVVIQHSRLIAGFEVWNFVASTCDFSMTQGVSSHFEVAWGKRNNCHPLQPSDLEPTSLTAISARHVLVSATAVAGSGIFFKLSQMTNNKDYNVSVWGVADVCGNQQVIVSASIAALISGAPGNNYADPLSASSTNDGLGASTKFNFTVSLYTGIDQTKFGANRFTDSSIMNKINTTTTGVLTQPCWSTFRGIAQQATTIAVDGGSQFEIYYGKSASDKNSYYRAEAYTTGGATTDFNLPTGRFGAVCLYKEFMDPSIQWAENDFVSTETNTGMSTDLTAASVSANQRYLAAASMPTQGAYGWAGNEDGYIPLFLYSATATNQAVGNSSSVFLRGDLTVAKAADSDSKQGLPTPIVKCVTTDPGSSPAPLGLNYKDLWGQAAGQLETYWSLSWFTSGTAVSATGPTTCVVSWQVSTGKEVQGANLLAATFSAIAAATPGIYKTLFYSTDAGVRSAFPGDQITGSAAHSLALNNYFMVATTTSTEVTINLTDSTYTSSTGLFVSSTATKIAIIGVFQAALATPGGKYYTINPSALGYKKAATIVIGTSITSLTCAIKTCQVTFNLYTNCLKWVAAVPTNKTLYMALDVIYRYMPAIGAAPTVIVNNGPVTVIRFIKLFPEAQGFQDVIKRKATTTTVNPFTFHHNYVEPESSVTTNGGLVCLVELIAADISIIATAASDTLAIFLFNIPLLNTDVTNAASTYPIGSLDSALAWGLNSAPAYSQFGQMGCKSVASEPLYGGAVAGTKTLGFGSAGLTNMSLPNDYTYDPVGTFDATKSISMTVAALTANSNNKRSMYPFLMGSVVLITGITKALGGNPVKNLKANSPATAGNQNLLIPTRCPNQEPASASAASKMSSYFTRVSAYVVSLAATDYKSFTSVEHVLYSSVAANTNTVIFPTINTKAATAAVTTIGVVVAKFYDYINITTTGSNKYLEASSATAGTASSFIVFLADGIVLEAAATGVGYNAAPSTSTTSMSYYSASSLYFYAWGIKFSQSLTIALAASGVTFSSTAKFLFQGITRPALGFWTASPAPTSATNAFSMKNKIAVFSLSLAAADNVGYTNIAVAASYVTTASLQQYTPVALTDATGILTLLTDGQTQYKTDAGGNILMTAGFPSTSLGVWPKWSQITLTSSLLSASSVCGLKTTTGASLAMNCTYGTALTCTMPADMTGSVSVCCYNVTTVASMTVTSFSILANGIVSDGSTNAISTYTPSTITAATLLDGTVVATDTTTGISGSIKTLTYSHLTKNGLGVITLVFSVTRAQARDGKIALWGDFSSLISTLVPVANIRCMATFSASGVLGTWDEGDGFIDTCNVAGLANTTADSIIVYTKKIIYKCSLTTLTTNITVDLIPVQLGQLPSTASFGVTMKVVSPGYSSSLLNTPTANLSLPTPPTLKYEPAVKAQADLCSLAFGDVFPRITNGLVDFKWTFDITTKKTELDAATAAVAAVAAVGTTAAVEARAARPVNEVTIFLPSKWFGDYANSNNMYQWCMVGTTQVNCSFSKPGVLNVAVGTQTSGTNFAVTLMNVPIGAIDENVTFFCTVNNNTSGNSGVRQNLITGSGSMKTNATTTEDMTGIQQSQTTIYNLTMWPSLLVGTSYSSFFGSSNEQRGSVDLTFRAGIDFSQAAPSVITIDNTPWFHIFLPSEFNGLWYQLQSTGYSPTIAIKEYSYAANTSTTVITPVESSTTFTLGTVMVSGNRLSVQYGSGTAATTLATSLTHQFFEFKISGLKGPQTALDTSKIRVAITNKTNKFLLRTFGSADTSFNGDTCATDKAYPTMPTPTTASLVPANSPVFTCGRGYKFGSTSKWDMTINSTNTCTSSAGRYTNQTFKVIPNAGLFASAGLAKLTGVSTAFTFPPNSSYTLKTSGEDLVVKIGSSCATTIPGTYILYFTVDNSNFLAPPACVTTVTNTTKLSCDFKFNGFTSAVGATIKGGALAGAWVCADNTFDDAIFSWTNSDTTLTGTLSSATVKANTSTATASFSIVSATETKDQGFTLGTVANTCVSSTVTTATVALSVVGSTLSASTDCSGWMVYQDPAKDAKISSSLKTLNALRWVLTLPTGVAPLNAYCALYCKNAAAPTDDEIMAGAQTTATPYLVAFWKQYMTAVTATDALFQPLARGQSYAIKCSYRTTESNTTAQKSCNYTSMNYTVAASGTTAASTNNYVPTPVESTVCVNINFKNAASADTVKKIVSYCQWIFSPAATSPVTTGCVICVDENQTTTTGYSQTANVTCPSGRRRLRVLKESNKRSLSTSNTTVVAKTYSVSVCAIPQPNCDTNVGGTRRLRNLATVVTGVAAKMTSGVQAALADSTKAVAVLGATVAADVIGATIIQDLVAPDVSTKVSYGTASYTAAGAYSVVVNYNDTVNSYDCWWQVLSGSTAPTAASIKACTSTSTCGKVSLASPSVTIAGTASPAFTIGTSYTVYYACYNKIPNAQKSSSVYTAYTFTAACPAGQTVSNGSCITPVPAPTTNTTGSSYVFMSIASLIAMIFILLN